MTPRLVTQPLVPALYAAYWITGAVGVWPLTEIHDLALFAVLFTPSVLAGLVVGRPWAVGMCIVGATVLLVPCDGGIGCDEDPFAAVVLFSGVAFGGLAIGVRLARTLEHR